MTLNGSRTSCRTLLKRTTAAIIALPVTPSVTVADKTYDGTTTANLASCIVAGAIAGEVLACTGAAAFDSASVGAGKTVTVSGVALTGAAASNYNTANNFRYNGGETIASAPKTSGQTNYTISYIVNAATTTPGGSYSGNQTLVCTGTY